MMRNRVLGLSLVFVSGVACKGSFMAVGALYVWNGTDRSAEISVAGRSSDEFFIGPHDGWLIEEAVAGPYTIKHGAATVWPASGSSTSLMARPRS